MSGQIDITMTFDGTKYKLVPRVCVRPKPCRSCAFDSNKGCAITMYWLSFNDLPVCERLHGIWKEVKYAEK